MRALIRTIRDWLFPPESDWMVDHADLRPPTRVRAATREAAMARAEYLTDTLAVDARPAEPSPTDTARMQ